MLKIFRDAPPVVNVVAGQNATIDLDVGWRYHAIRLIATVTKTAATANPVVEPLLSEALGLIVANVNSDPKRTHLATELNAIQTRWAGKLAAKLYSKTASDLITTVNDVVAGGNTARTSTWVIDVWFSEPSRDSYTARQAFAWPTSWNNAAIGNYPANYTANIQLQIGVPSDASLTNQAIRAEMMVDTIQGPVVDANLATILTRAGINVPPVGTPIMPVTHWYRFPEDYSSTAIAIRKWPFTGGSVQELDLFSPAGDDVAKYQILTDNAIKRTTTKSSNDQENISWGWSENYGAGTAGINYLAADMINIAFDFDDDPGSALSTATFGTLELDLTLTQAAAANKAITFLAQVYRNALLL